MKTLFTILLTAILLATGGAYAQTPVYQSGAVTPGDPVVWTANRYVGDGTLNGGFTSFTITNSLPSFNYYDAQQSTGNYHLLQLGANSTSSAGLISYSAVGSVSTQPLLFTINGGTITMNGNVLTVGAAGAAQGSLVFCGVTSGCITLKGAAIAGTYNLIPAITSGTAGQVWASGGGSAASTWDSVSGSSTTLLLLDSAATNGHCPQFDSSGGVVDSGASCASSGVGAGVGGNIPWYSVSGSNIVGNANLNISAAALTVGVAGTSQGSIGLTGATIGTFIQAVPSSVTSYTITWPAAVPSSGQVLMATSGSGTLGWGAPGVSCCTYESGNFNAVANTGYCVDTTSTSITATLEASPSSPDAYYFLDCKNSFPVNNLTLARNGNTIMNQAANMVDTTLNGNFTLQWDPHFSNWIVR